VSPELPRDHTILFSVYLAVAINVVNLQKLVNFTTTIDAMWTTKPINGFFSPPTGSLVGFFDGTRLAEAEFSIFIAIVVIEIVDGFRFVTPTTLSMLGRHTFTLSG
jgi:hypothetical protein